MVFQTKWCIVLSRLKSLHKTRGQKEMPALKTATKVATKATKVATTPAEVVIAPAVQRQVKALRISRDAEKVAKAEASVAREALLAFFGEVTQNTIGTDAKGKRLVSVKVIPSSEKIDWTEMQKQNPELYESVRQMIREFIIPKGADTPTIRVDVI